MQNKRLNDYPELQIGYPERNDVRNPNWEMERYHVDFDSFKLSRTNAKGVSRDHARKFPVEDKQ